MTLLSISRRMKNILLLGAIFISLIIAFNKSNIVDAFLRPKDVKSESPKRALTLFESNEYNQKIELEFVTQDISSFKQTINKIIIENNLNSIYSSAKTNKNICKLLEIPQDKYSEILAPLLTSNDLTSEELVQAPDFLTISDIEDRIKTAEKLKKRMLEDNKSSSSLSYKDQDITELQQQIEDQENRIEDLKSLLQQKKNKSGVMLAKIDVSNIVYKSSIIKIAINSFGITFFISLIFITLSLIVIYLILVGFAKLLRILGIRTTSGGGSSYGSRYGGYSSYGGYGGYGGYSSGRKKIKRKYIRKDKSKEPETDSKDK
ncbi:MAG: hypothetical protein U9P79_00680 [Candidatus Cloacimonadota bacterium]|nr:hypothetical protein [Candidatus Cloacimonadota bacterium]